MSEILKPSKLEYEQQFVSPEELAARAEEQALADPLRDPVAEADGYRDTMPDDDADALSLARGEIAWLREAVRRLTIALEATRTEILKPCERAREFLAVAHEEAKRHTVAVDIRTGNIGRPAGVVWVETTTALKAIQAAIAAMPRTDTQLLEALEALRDLLDTMDAAGMDPGDFYYERQRGREALATDHMRG